MVFLGEEGTLDVVPESFTVNVLFQQGPKGCLATAMEMDIQGFGHTEDEAKRALSLRVCMQVAFAIQKKMPRLLLKPAEPHLWEIFNAAREASLHRMMTNAPAGDEEFSVGSLPIDHKLIEQARARKPFRRAYAA